MQSSIWFIFDIQIYTRGMYTYISYTSDLQNNEKDGAPQLSWESVRNGLQWATAPAARGHSRQTGAELTLERLSG